MKESNPVKKAFSSVSAEMLIVTKMLSAVFLIIFILLTTTKTDFTKFLTYGDIGNYLEMTAYGFKFFFALPLVALAGMDVVWTIALIRAGPSDHNGSLLLSGSSVSLGFTSLGVFADLSFVIFLFGNLGVLNELWSLFSFSSTFRGKKSLILLLIFSICGLICMLPIAVMRARFYRKAEKSLTTGAPVGKTAIFYALMKLVGMMFRFGFIGMFVFIMKKLSGISEYGPVREIYAILIVGTVISLIGAASCALEARVAFMCRDTADQQKAG